MDLVFSESSSRMLSEYWYKYKADHYIKLYAKPIYSYIKPVPCSISLQYTISFYGGPKYKNNLINLFKKLNEIKICLD